MADRVVPAIFEAAFEHAGIRVRVDVLERRPRGYWGMYEVKSSGDTAVCMDRAPHEDLDFGCYNAPYAARIPAR
jgi:hypothetical protein